MKAEVFSSPIFVKRATYLVQEIASLADAIEFLDEWPADRRDQAHETALRACICKRCLQCPYRLCEASRRIGGSNSGYAMERGL